MFFKKNKNARKENRRSPRYKLYQSSYYLTENGGQAVTDECWLNDISDGGVSLDSSKDIPPGRRITVLYKIGTKVRREEAVVRRCGKFIHQWRCGCEFTGEDTERSRILEDYYREKE